MKIKQTYNLIHKMSQSRRRVLSLAACTSCHEAGFSSAEESAIELLTVMLQSFITECGRSSQLLAEHNGRCQTTPNDVILSLIEMGTNVDSLLEYGKKRIPLRIPAPARESQQKQPTILHTGPPRPLHSYIPDYFPPFPDSHSYIRTTTHRQPITEYEAIRDKAATQKRDLERALTKFVAKTMGSNPEHCLFAQNPNLDKSFPLIGIQPCALPFMNALLPKDQIFDDNPSSE